MNIYEIRHRRNPLTRRTRWWVTTVRHGNSEPLCHSEMLNSPEAAEANAAAQMDGAPGGVVRWIEA